MRDTFKILGIGIIIGVILYGIDTTNQILSGATFEFGNDQVKIFGFYLLYTLSLTLVNFYFFEYLNHRVDWEKYNQKYRLVIGVFGSVGITLFTLFIIRIIHKVILEGTPFNEFISTQNLEFYFRSIIITLVISLFFHAFYLYKMVQDKKVKEQRIIAGSASAKFESLKNQIDPHFLFNSLNVLTSLIEESPENAQKFTTSLSKIYRYVLEQKDKELVSVEEELAFAKTYMNLLKMRFENSVFYEVPEKLSNPEGKVVPLALQLLLENSVKHNIVSENKPLNIRIYEEDVYLIVENNYQKKEVMQDRKGLGLQNIVDRYSLITSRKVLIEQKTRTFRVKIPILTKQFTIKETIQNSENNSFYKAKQRVKKIKEFYGRLISYCVIMPILIFVNYYTSWDFQWFWFPLFGWGLGLTIRGFSVFGYGANWEEQKIKELMDKEKQTNKTWN